MKLAIDRSSWGRLRVTGGDRVRFLQGLTTVNVEALAPGAHGWGAILNPKGRVLSVIDVTHMESVDGFVIACEQALAAPTRALLERYAVMDDVIFEALEGPALQTWTSVADVWTAPIVSGTGDVEEADAAVERLRIRAGLPRYGVDVDADHFPFETPIGQFLDYKKGCYVGQEPVFRVHAQGNAANQLRGFAIDGDAEIAAGVQIKHPARDNAGKITSSIPAGDGTVWALGYLHRTALEGGGSVEIAGRRATVHELPW